MPIVTSSTYNIHLTKISKQLRKHCDNLLLNFPMLLVVRQKTSLEVSTYSTRGIGITLRIFNKFGSKHMPNNLNKSVRHLFAFLSVNDAVSLDVTCRSVRRVEKAETRRVVVRSDPSEEM